MLSLALLFSASTASAALPPRPIRHFGDWVVACDNGRKCQAVALVPEDQGEDGLPFATLAVERGAANSDLPALAVRMDLDEIAPLSRIVLDERPGGFALEHDGTLDNSADAPPLLRRLAVDRGARVLDLGGKPVARISLAGAAAALRWMDEQQLRANSNNATVATGRAVGIQVAPQLPRIVPPPHSAKPPRTLSPTEIETIRARYECGAVAESHVTDVVRLDARHSLAIIPCMLHAYQSSSIAVVLPESGSWRPAPLERRFATEAGESTPEWMTEPEFDAETSSLWSHSKGRGIGDCGNTEAYVWDGAVFRLAYMATMDRCQGSRARLTLWRTANHPEP